MNIAFFGFDSRHTTSKNESAKSSFLIFPHLTPQVASDGHIVFPKSISRFLGSLSQMSPTIIVYMCCSQSKYSNWQHEGRLEEWEEGQNVKYRCTKARKDFFWWFIVCYFGISKCFLASSLQCCLQFRIKHILNSKAPFLRERIYYFMPHSHVT